VDKQQLKDWKTIMNRRVEALRMLAKDKSPVEVADKFYKGHKENLQRALKEFRSEDVPFMSAILDAVRNERLLEKGKGNWVQKARESKITKAEQGFYMKARLTGYKVRDGELFEIKDEIKRVKGVLHDFRESTTEPLELAKKYKLALSTIRRILSQQEYKGESVFMGKTYKLDTQKGNWEPILTLEQYNEIQSMLHAPAGGSRLSKLLYRWKNGKWVGRPGAKELANKIVDLRLKGKSSAAIAHELEISRTPVDRVLKDKRVTGDDNFEALVDKDRWERAQEVHVPTFYELEEKRSAERKQKIVTYVPAYRWEIREKMGLTKIVANFLIEVLLKDMLKERPDGLLQIGCKDFPNKVLATRRKPETQRIKKILELLQVEKKMKLVELQQKTGFSEPNIQKHISRLRKMGILEREDYWGYRIKDDWAKRVARWLSQPHIAEL